MTAPKLTIHLPGHVAVGLAATATDLAHGVWREAGLSLTPIVEILATNGPLHVGMDGRPLLVSARRVEEAVTIALGRNRRPGEEDEPRQRLASCLADLPDDDRARLVLCYLDAVLRTNLVTVVAAERHEQARACFGDDRPLHVDALLVLAELGVPPARLAARPSISGAPAGEPDPARLVEVVLGDLDSASLLVPELIIGAQDLRRLTLDPGAFVNDDNGTSSRQQAGDLVFVLHGVPVPGIDVCVDRGGASGVARVAVGGFAGPALPLLAPGTSVSTERASELAAVLDPLTGTWGSLLGGPIPPGTSLLAGGPWAFLVRGIHQECRGRLGLWVPPLEEWMSQVIGGLPDSLAQLVGPYARPVLRRLVAAGATVRFAGQVTEGLLRGLAQRNHRAADLERQVRQTVGARLLGPAQQSRSFTELRIEESAAAAAVEAGHAGPLLEAQPALADATAPCRVVVPGLWADDCRTLLRPLLDAVTVAGDDELGPAHLAG